MATMYSTVSVALASADLYPPTVPPAARALPLSLSLLRFVRNPLRSLPRAVYDQPIVTYGRKRPLVAWVTDPGLIEQVLVKRSDLYVKTRLDKRVLRPMIGEGLLTADGDHWRWQRKLASPLFRPSDVSAYVPVIVKAAHEQVARWRNRGASHVAPIDRDMTSTTFAVIARTILAGIDESEAAEIQRTGHAYIDPIMWSVASALMLIPEHYWYPGRRKMLRAAKESRAVVQRLLDKRRAAGAGRDGGGDDLIARMLAARNPDTGAPMSDEHLIDNLGTFLLAGHETTAKALTWTLYLLARAPAWQERVRSEVYAVTGGAEVTADDIAKLNVTQRVLKEAMRLYPPVPAMTRVNLEATELGGHDLPQPTLIVIPVFAVHRHNKLWNDPDKFDPDRFLPEREAKNQRTQFMPFGVGPRVCIGASFAMIEATAVLATLLQHARFTWDGTHLPEPISRVTLHPKGGMPLNVTML
jgi:cytochrome P450